MAPSGVGTQALMLINGLIKTGKYSFICLGAAIKHPQYDTVLVNPDFIVKPIDGFGDREKIRQILYTEKPDAVLLITDPRFFHHVWEMEDEIHQVCPITYWHVWDNDPYPVFNEVWYKSTDLINCISHKTYELVKPHFPEKTNYIPHAFPKDVYFNLPKEETDKFNQEKFGEKANWFKAIWVNRNATRKMPGDLLNAWKLFLDTMQEKHGHKNALLLMHTNPKDQEGPDLFAVCDQLNLQGHVYFSTDILDFPQMNLMYNSVDCGVNISKAEGFGLMVLTCLSLGKPVVVNKTGGMTRQVIDSRDGFEYGAGIEPAARTLVGSQMVPFIYDDHINYKDVASGLMKVFELTDNQKTELAHRAKNYVEHEFNYDSMISEWDKTLTKTMQNWTDKTNLQTKRYELLNFERQAYKMPQGAKR